MVGPRDSVFSWEPRGLPQDPSPFLVMGLFVCSPLLFESQGLQIVCKPQGRQTDLQGSVTTLDREIYSRASNLLLFVWLSALTVHQARAPTPFFTHSSHRPSHIQIPPSRPFPPNLHSTSCNTNPIHPPLSHRALSSPQDLSPSSSPNSSFTTTFSLAPQKCGFTS